VTNEIRYIRRALVKLQRLSLSVLIAAIVALIATGASVRAATPAPALFTLLPGTWNCTFQGPKGTQITTPTFTASINNWVSETGKVGAYGNTAAHEDTSIFSYDSKKGEYVSMGGSSVAGGDDWGVGTAKASPTATTMTFVNAYPADPTHEKDVYSFSASKVSWTSTWTEKGKVMTGHGSCTKQ
jgi:hypothetical protein